jgi:hypothetical protein
VKAATTRPDQPNVNYISFPEVVLGVMFVCVFGWGMCRWGVRVEW